MDLSKLPKLSETPRPNVEPTPLDVPVARRELEGAGSPADSWLSIGIGLIILFISPRFLQYALSPSTFSEKWKFNDGQGNPLTYPQTVFFWGDLALTVFALVLIIEGIVFAFGRRRLPLIGALLLTGIATLLNLGFVVAMLARSNGFQLFSGIATVIGVYMTMHQWRLLQAMRA